MTGKKRGSNVTNRDVAKLAGVSQATVSYVLNGKEQQKISAKTRERVLLAARELEYVPNRQARSLRSRSSGCVSVMMDKFLQHPRYAGVTEGLRRVLDEEGYRILLCGEQPENGYPQYLAAYLEKRADGIVYIGADGKIPRADVLDLVKERKIPFVAYDCEIADEKIATVTLDYRAAVRQVIRRLKEKGCGSICYLGPDSRIPQERQRREELALVCGREELPWEEYRIETDQFFGNNASGEVERIYRLVRQTDHRTGVVFAWSSMLTLALSRLDREDHFPEMAVLTDDCLQTFAGWRFADRILYSDQKNRICGEACGRELIRQMREPETGAVKQKICPGLLEGAAPFEDRNKNGTEKS